MTRYFYKDPLAAAWMEDKFGMEFVSSDGREVIILDGVFDFKKPTVFDRGPEKAYIHPETVALLEPQPGDLVKVMGNVGYIPAGEGFAEKYALRLARSNCQPHATGRIIQRNGLAFIWPESEAA